MRRIHVEDPNAQCKQHRDSAVCWCCKRAPQAAQTDKHRDGLCAACRRRVEEFWGKRNRKRAA